MYKEKKNVISSKIVSLIMSVIVLMSALPIGVLADNYLLYDDIPSSKVSSNTDYTSNKYSSHWEYWSQGASQYRPYNPKDSTHNTVTSNGDPCGAMNYGCHVVAQAKLLVESGLTSSNKSIFNPDIFFKWGANKEYWRKTDTLESSDGNTCVKYASEVLGVTITRGSVSGFKNLSKNNKINKVMEFINKGYYVILSCSEHQAYIGRQASLKAGKPIILNSNSTISVSRDLVCTYEGYTARNFDTMYYYSVPVQDENVDAFNSSINTSAAGYYYLTTSNAPIRRSPSVSAETVETLSKGDIIYVSASGKNTANNTWYRTTNGYIYPYTDNGSSRLAKITSPYIFELSDVKNHNSSLSSSDYVCSVVKANTGYSLSNSTSFGCIIYVKSNNTYTEVARATDNKTISHDFMYYNISQNPTASNTKFLTSSGTQYKFTSGNVYFYRFFMTYNNKSNYSYSYNYANDTPYFKFVSSGTHTHSYGDWVYYDEAQHKATCTSCDAVRYQNHTWDSGTVTKAATHTSTGVKTYTCTACGATKTETIAKTTTHSFGAWTKLNDTQHQRTCACGEKQTENHTWDSGTVTKPASYTETGVRTYTCTVCNATKTETIAKLDKPVDPNLLQFVIGNANAKPGETIKVNITLKNNPGISSFKFYLVFDNGLILIDAKYGDLFTADNMYINTESCPAMFNWIRFGSNASDDGTFVTLTFKVADNVKYGEKLRIYAVCEQNNIFNTDFEEIAFEATDGFVTVSNHILGDINGDGTADNKDVVTLFNYVSGANVYVVEGSTDVNGDGLTNNKDIVVLFKYVSGVNITIY